MSHSERNGCLQRQPPRAWVSQQFSDLEVVLVRYVARYLQGNVEAARDVVQDAFLKLCEQPWPDIEQNVRAWLYRCCRNAATDFIRREVRMKNAIRDDLEINLQADVAQSSPDYQVGNREELAQVQALIRQLSLRQQELLRLRLQENLSYREIAHVTGLTVTNVGFQLHQAITTLRQSIRSGM
ncbi:MAG: sigma-70 family RNA polymerase sigma factor [Planctomycetales bacterium]|nr:sigma-70 family RNA polymerase sigma factor [Planctomycetales bacterium]